MYSFFNLKKHSDILFLLRDLISPFTGAGQTPWWHCHPFWSLSSMTWEIFRMWVHCIQVCSMDCKALCSVWFQIEGGIVLSSVQFSCSVVSDSLRPHNRSTPRLPVHHQLLEFTQTHVHGVSDAIQPSHPLPSPSPPAPNPSHHQSLFQWVNSSHEVAKVLEFQL